MKPNLFYLPSDQGKLLITQFSPDEPDQACLHVLLIPPFCEEMNKSRKMLTTFARQAAQQNITVSLIDLFGTGDSEGELVATTWPIWQQNIVSLHQFVKGQQPAVPIALLGLRTGAMLALDCCIKQLFELPVTLMLWQPVLNGKQFLNQFMRMRLAAEMVNESAKITMTDLQQQLLDDGDLEVAGYRISHQLSEQISEINLTKLEHLPKQLKIRWLEVGQAPKTDLLPISQKILKSWQQMINASGYFMVGDSFWQTQEITLCQSLSIYSVELLLEGVNE